MSEEEFNQSAPRQEQEIARPCLESVELPLHLIQVDEAARLICSADTPQILGALAARLVELGGASGSSRASGDDLHIYTAAMSQLKHRLEAAPMARQVFAIHPRTFARPSRHLVTAADDWVAPVVMAEVAQLDDTANASFCRMLLNQVGHQHALHPDFRPLLVKLSATRAMLDALMDGGDGGAATLSTSFVDVVMQDAADGTELEAAVWGDALSRLSEAADMPLVVSPTVQSMAALLALVDRGRARHARQSAEHRHAALATRAAIAEFVFAWLMGLSDTFQPCVMATMDIGTFIRRDVAGRMSDELPKALFEPWAARQTPEDLFRHLVLLQLAAKGALPLPSASSDKQARMQAAIDHLDVLERHPSATSALKALGSGWRDRRWAGAA